MYTSRRYRIRKRQYQKRLQRQHADKTRPAYKLCICAHYTYGSQERGLNPRRTELPVEGSTKPLCRAESADLEDTLPQQEVHITKDRLPVAVVYMLVGGKCTVWCVWVYVCVCVFVCAPKLTVWFMCRVWT